MLLAKNCMTKDNIFKRGTVRLGSLYEYRATESAQIADKDEGKFLFTLKFDGVVELERKWANTIFAGFIHYSHREDGEEAEPVRIPGRYRFSGPNFTGLGHTQKTVTIRDSEVTMERESINGFIFCMSEVRKTHDAAGLFPKYDDCWYLNANKANDVANEITTSLQNKIITEREAGNHLIPAEIPIETLKIYCRHELVHYIPRNILISAQSDMTIEEFISRSESVHFVKPPCFEREKEYRFSFTISSNGRIIEPLRNNVILQADRLTEWAFTL